MSELLVFIAEMELQSLEYDGEVKTFVTQTFTFEMYFTSSSTLTNYNVFIRYQCTIYYVKDYKYIWLKDIKIIV